MTEIEKEPLLRMVDICKSFPGVKALDGAHLELYSGSVHALMGENGAGKSTLMKCLFGVNRKDSGHIYLKGEEVSFRSSAEAMSRGVAMVHQELNQALTMTVSENMWLGRFPRLIKHLPFINAKKMDEDTARILEELGVDVDPREKMGRLSVAKRQLVEIGKAISYGARVIAFDEPTSSLTESESEILFNIIERLKGDGCGIIYISHKMSEIMRICDRVTVMRDGRHIVTEQKENLSTDKIIHLMVGRELKNRYPKRDTPQGGTLLEVRNLTGAEGKPRSVDLTLGRGEILGVAGLDGSGRTELLETIFGTRKMTDGEVRLEGEVIKNSSPTQAKRNGFAFLTEERRASGIFGILGISENATIASIKRHRGLFLLSKRKLNEATDECIRSMRIKTPSRSTKISTLSGGNQQKVILGRWLLTEPRVLLLDEPTRGIDVGAKYEIYLLITNLARCGRGVIVVSSEMAELQGLCDRIIVMSGGEIAGEVDAKTCTQEQIMTLAAKNL